MHLSVASLNSGSNGNCYYVGTDEEAVLVDVGISCREVEARMKLIGLDIEKVKAIFISHEHADHIRGIPVLANKFKIPVYSTPATRRGCGFRIAPDLVRNFSGDLPIGIGALTVQPFSKVHDAADPYSFTVSGHGVTIGVFTDLGIPCAALVRHFKKCHGAFLESNYDEAMLEAGRYPYYLKKRIRGGQGHLSNAQALELFRTHRTPQLTHLFLSHLSNNNNDPQLVADLFAAHAENTNIVVASRFEASPVYHISSSVQRELRQANLLPSERQLVLAFE